MQCTHGTHPNFLGLLSETDTHSCTYHEYIRPALERRRTTALHIHSASCPFKSLYQSMSSPASSSKRPTLPPLRTLNLLPPCTQRQGDSVYDSYDRPCPTLNVPHHTRRVSTSTSSSTSRTPSPTPSDAGSLSSATSSSSSSSSKLTLVPCASFEDAEAVVLIPPPGTEGTRGLLLMGPALARLRCPQRPLAKGTRVHPYRIARRRASA
ncbi:hypothetical protein B0H14DRAFT_2832536 [Mycena olivaceomarginata]|nr:hypothetical protein B0H14DRAFT_2832536 [Mycena olivaceomarginata]